MLQIWRAEPASYADVRGQTFRQDIERGLAPVYTQAAVVGQGRGEIEDFDAVARELVVAYPGVDSRPLAWSWCTIRGGIETRSLHATPPN